MNPDAWCGPATLENIDVLESVHCDYVRAGADVITANTYASSRLMLAPAGFGDRFREINTAAIAAAHRARNASGRDDVLVAGSLSHMCPMIPGTGTADSGRAPSGTEMADAFGELSALLLQEGCDLILLEMMYHPERIRLAVKAATATGLPVWAGFSARRDNGGHVLSFAPEEDIPFADIVRVLEDFEVAAAGVMHTPANLIGEADNILSRSFAGLRMAYPDSGYFRMPHWEFEDIIPPARLADFAAGWIENGVCIVGGCCGLSPEHIAALSRLKR
jgi:homocysteine S-methyltransferase